MQYVKTELRSGVCAALLTCTILLIPCSQRTEWPSTATTCNPQQHTWMALQSAERYVLASLIWLGHALWL